MKHSSWKNKVYIRRCHRMGVILQGPEWFVRKRVKGPFGLLLLYFWCGKHYKTNDQSVYNSRHLKVNSERNVFFQT